MAMEARRRRVEPTRKSGAWGTHQDQAAEIASTLTANLTDEPQIILDMQRPERSQQDQDTPPSALDVEKGPA